MKRREETGSIALKYGVLEKVYVRALNNLLSWQKDTISSSENGIADEDSFYAASIKFLPVFFKNHNGGSGTEDVKSPSIRFAIIPEFKRSFGM